MNYQLSNNRYVGLDVIRGVVILAILIININYISTPSVIRYNPSAFGEFSWLDQWVWAFEYSFIKQRFMPILALLFGAGIYLFACKFESKEQSATWPFIKRTISLALIGLAHAYLIWDGDILFAYAVCGLIAYMARNFSNSWLLGLGVLLVISPLIPELISLIPSIGTAGDVPEFWTPNQEKIASLLSAYQGSWWSLTPERIETAIGRQTIDLIYFTLWRCTGLMFIGIVLMRNGFLRGESHYHKGLTISLLFGLPTSVIGTFFYIQSGYDFNFFNTILTLCFYIGTLCMAYAYLCLLLIWTQSSLFPTLQRGLARVGQMALTLYLSQSLICAFIFYGWGLGLYGQVSRSGVMLITAAIIVAQFVFVQFWMKRFRNGPIEYVWRKCYSLSKNKPSFEVKGLT